MQRGDEGESEGVIRILHSGESRCADMAQRAGGTDGRMEGFPEVDSTTCLHRLKCEEIDGREIAGLASEVSRAFGDVR